MTETRVVLSTREKDYVALPVGTEVGRYTIRGVLGQGGFGVTYRAHDRSLDREVAIKEYLPTAFAVRGDGFIVVPTSTRSAEDFSWGRQRFTEEGRMLASFQQAPGIVRVYDFLEANGTAYIVMELVHGITLGQRLDRGTTLSADETELILRPLLDGLAQIHAAGIVHRDIKPDNILLDAVGRPTLIDFGAARAAMAGRTEAVTALYTPGYAAVEQFNDTRQGPWTDIYGLSATLYHAISGNKAPTAIDRALDDTCKPLAKLRPAGFPRELLAGLDRGMAVRSDDRPQSIDAWRPMFVAAPPRPADRRNWRIAAYGALGVLVLAGAAGGTWMMLASPKPADGAAAPAQADQEAQRQALAAQQQRERTEAEARSRAAAEEARRKAEAETAARAQAEEEARQRAAQEEARLRAEADARQRAAQAEAQRVADAEADARAKAAEETRQRTAQEEARRAAEADAAARARAAEEARQRAAQEEARRKAEADAAAHARAEEEARQRAAQAEARRAAEAEAAARAKAAEEARQSAAAEETRRRAEAEARARTETERLGRTAEAGEAALRLSVVDRQRLQVALTARGFDTRGADGALGPRSREMIAAWQKAHGHAATGYVDAAQQQQLLREATAAIARFDEDQKKAEEARQAAPARPAPRPGERRTAAAVPQAGGSYAGSFAPPSEIDIAGANGRIGLTLENGAGSGTIGLSGGVMPKRGAFSFAVAPDGSISGQGQVPNNRGPALAVTLQGRVEGTRIRLEFVGLRAPLAVTLDRAE